MKKIRKLDQNKSSTLPKNSRTKSSKIKANPKLIRNLMSSNDVLKTVETKKGSHSILIENISRTAFLVKDVHVRVLLDARDNLLQLSCFEKLIPVHRIVPHHLPDPGSRRAIRVLNDLGRAGVYGVQLVKTVGNAAMSRKDGSLDDRTTGESVADVVDKVPKLESIILSIFIKKFLLELVSILRRPVLVVPSEKSDFISI